MQYNAIVHHLIVSWLTNLPVSISLSLPLSLFPWCQYLQHGITCIGFRDKEEKEKFCHQLERAVRWLDERAQKQKEKVMEAGERQMRGRDETDGHAHQ